MRMPWFLLTIKDREASGKESFMVFCLPWIIIFSVLEVLSRNLLCSVGVLFLHFVFASSSLRLHFVYEVRSTEFFSFLALGG